MKEMSEYSRTVTVTTQFDHDILIQSVNIGQDLVERIAFDVVKLKEQGIRDALIAMGWTPPPDNAPIEPDAREGR